MKILALNINQGNVNRGLESFLAGLAKELDKKKIDFRIIGSEKSRSYPNLKINKVLHKLYLDKYSLEVFIFTFQNLKKIIKFRPDIMIPANGGWQILIIRIFRIILKYKIVIIGEAGIGYDDWFNLKFSHADLFVALTNEQFTWANRINKKIRIVRISNGVNLKQFTPFGEKIEINLPRPIFLCVSALDAYKNIDMSIETVSKLEKGSLVVLGEGVMRDALYQLGKAKLNERFLMKKVEFSELPKWYRTADIFTLVSGFQEAFGNVYLEAMACGLPVVATNDTKRHEIIGEAGLFIDPGNTDEYKTALMKAAIISWGEKPRLQAEKFGWQIIGEKYYQELLKL